MARWPISDQQARDMYAGGRANADARWYARVWGKAFGWGLFPRRWVTLEVPGRRSGKLMSVPLGMADVDRRWYLVSMLGEQCNWVLNARAANGRVVLRRRRRTSVVLVDVPIAERGPILRRYVQKAPGGRPHIPVEVDAPLAEFEAVACRFPVFAVLLDTPSGPEPMRVARRRWPWAFAVAGVVATLALAATIRERTSASVRSRSAARSRSLDSRRSTGKDKPASEQGV